MRSRFSASAISSSSASPRVPTSENACSRCPSAKSSQAAISSRLSCSRCSASSRRQAGSSFRNVYLTKCRAATARLSQPIAIAPGLRSERADRVSPCGSRWSRRTLGPIPAASRATSRRLPPSCSGSGTRRASSRRSTPTTRSRARLHRGARPQRCEPPEGFVSLGRTFGLPANGAVSNIAVTPTRDLRLAPRAARGRL